MKITAAFIQSIAPGASPAVVAGIVANGDLLANYGIVSNNQIAMFFGQWAEETGGFTRLEENLFYTSVARLRQVWPSRFKSDASAAPYVRNPKGLADLVYNGRMGNVVGSDDGYSFRGSGLPQLTGRTNYARYAADADPQTINLPERVRLFPGALLSACWYWAVNKLNRFADANDIIGLTKAVNGGLTNLADRRLYTDRAVRAIPLLTIEAVPAIPVSVDASGWLRKGATGQAVTIWQQWLAKLGYYKGGKIDGTFGDATDDATRHFQTDHGLVHDGVVGPSTRTAAKAALAAPVPSPIDPHMNPPNGPLAPAASVPVPSEPGGLAAVIRAVLALLAGIIGGKGKKP